MKQNVINYRGPGKDGNETELMAEIKTDKYLGHIRRHHILMKTMLYGKIE